MKLEQLITFLQQYPADKVVPLGFCNPHSYRGNFWDLAFEPRENVTVGEMLAVAENAVGKSFVGYKGGKFKMGRDTECYLANYGCSGETLGGHLLKYMVGDY